MRIDYTGRQVEIGEELRQYTQDRLKKIVRLLGERIDLHVILTAEKHRRIAELTLKSGDQSLVGVSETSDVRLSINDAVDKLARQAVRLQERYDERFRWEQLITHSFDLDGANEALQAVRSGAAIKAVIRPNG
jgi:putative sigma-54 modulation protein